MQEYGPQTAFGQRIFREKYALAGESFRDMCSRLAAALTFGASDYHGFREILLNQRFLPGGRIQAAIGTGKNVCAHNCFVSGRIDDSFVDGPSSIMGRAHQAASTMRMGGGIGYDFSTLRPRGALIRKLQSNATGPVSFMSIFDAVGLATCSSGHRRGAQMGILRVDHPDIEEFVHAKNNGDKLTGFNISVAITDAFMNAVEVGATEFPLVFEGQVYRTVNPQALWDAIMRSAWDWAEPGVVFIDRMNEMNNLRYCETFYATNPCSEQPLPEFGACLLGSFNLVKYVKQAPNKRGLGFDMPLLHQDIQFVVRAMDTVNDVARYPLPEQQYEALQKRRMGLGVTGLANAIEALGSPYGSSGFLEMMHTIFQNLANWTYKASSDLAAEKGSFPAFNAAEYLKSKFIAHLNPEIQDLIAYQGIRNSHLISMAPTGTISLAADGVSSGIEPVFQTEYTIGVRDDFGDYEQLPVMDYGMRVFDTQPRLTRDVTIDEHIAVLAKAQFFTDSAVSKTCNVYDDCSWEDFKAVYVRAWRLGAKGCSVFNNNGRRAGVLQSVAPAADEVSPQPGCVSGLCEV